MKIAYIVSRFPQLSESFVLRELDELDRQGIEVVLCPLLRQHEDVVHPEAQRWIERAWYTPFVSPALVRDAIWQIRTRPGRALGALATALVRVAGSWNLLVGTLGIWLKAFHLARRFEREGVDRVHAHFATHPALAAWLVHRLTGIPYSFTVHAHDLYVRTAMLREKMAEAEFVVTVSEFNRLRLGRFGDPAKVHVVRCGIELERYALQEEPPAGPATILTVASLQEYKGVDRLVRACALLAGRRLPEWRCRIVGGGVLRRELERLIEELGVGDRVELCGPKPQEEVAQLLSESHLFVLPSVMARNGQMEGLPVALMEALAVGLPVIASDLSGLPELVRPGETGILVPPGDVEALADAIAVVLADPVPARRLGRAGRRLVEDEFVLADNVSELVRLFRGRVPVEAPVP